VFNRVVKLIQKDVLLELRQKYSLYGILLYIISAVFMISMLNDQPESLTWNTLFWIIMVFITVNAVAKSFLQESKNRNIYYYSIVHPREIILSKMIYNIILMLLLSFISYLIFILLLGNPALNVGKFLLMVFTGGISLSLLFTLLAAIAQRAGGNSALIAILGFPLVIPQLILLSDMSRPLFEVMKVTNWWSFFVVLIALDVLIILLSYLLFPFLWKE
jgi:heme exporter protein B